MGRAFLYGIGGGITAKPNIVPLTITENGVYEARAGVALAYDTEVKFKDVITEADFKAYIANATPVRSNNGQDIYVVAAPWMVASVPDLNVCALVNEATGQAFGINISTIMPSALDNTWINLNTEETNIEVPTAIITENADVPMSADLTTTGVFFDIGPIDAYCPVTVDIVTTLKALEITENGTYKASDYQESVNETFVITNDSTFEKASFFNQEYYAVPMNTPELDINSIDWDNWSADFTPFKDWFYKFTSNKFNVELDGKTEFPYSPNVEGIRVIDLFFDIDAGLVSLGSELDSGYYITLFSIAPSNYNAIRETIKTNIGWYPEDDASPNTVYFASMQDYEGYEDIEYTAEFTSRSGESVTVDGFSEVVVNIPVPEGELVITEDGTYDVTQYSSVVVDVIDTEPGEDFDGTIVISGEAQEEDELAGTWVFNTSHLGLEFDWGVSYSWNVNFNSNNNDYNSLTVGQYDDPDLALPSYLKHGEDYAMNYNEWTSDACKTIAITSKLAEVENGAELLAYLKANATKEGSEVIEYYTTSITYNGLTTRIDAAGQKTTLGMKDLKATSDIEIGFGSKGFVIYNGQTTSVKAGQTATLICAGKQLVDDVIIDTTSIRYTVEITESGSMLVLDGHTTEENENGTTVVVE